MWIKIKDHLLHETLCSFVITACEDEISCDGTPLYQLVLPHYSDIEIYKGSYEMCKSEMSQIMNMIATQKPCLDLDTFEVIEIDRAHAT